MAGKVKAQVVATRYVQLDGEDRHRRDRGQTIEVSSEELERGIALGALRKPADSPLPEANVAASEAAGLLPTITQPDGTPIENVEVTQTSDFKAPRTHAEADAMATSLGVTFPDKAKLDEKVEALEQVAAARAAGEAVPDQPTSTENLADLSDKELIQRGIDFGHVEEEMVEKSHDELVLFVAEAMNRQGSTEAAQQRSVTERTEPVSAAQE